METSFTPDIQNSDYWLTVRQVDLPCISNFIKSGHPIQLLSNIKHIDLSMKAIIASLSLVLAMPVIFSEPFNLLFAYFLMFKTRIYLLALPASQY